MITYVVITCNRLYYLKNCVSSILEFADLDKARLLIIDNCTVEPGFKAYLETLPDYVDVKLYDKRSPNELYRSMNYAIRYAKDHGDKYVNFIQDDYQFLYKFPEMNRLVDEAFEKYHDIGQLQFNMGWKYKIKKIGKITVRDVNGVKWFLFHNKPLCDNGFTKISVYDEIGLYPSNTSMKGKEKGFSIKGEGWLARNTKKYRRMSITQPNIGMIMDCAYVRGNKRMGRYFSPPNKYYLKPFDDEKIDIIKFNSVNNKVSFIEDLVEPYGWVPLSDGKHSKHFSIEDL